MKKLLISALFLVSSTAFACPNCLKQYQVDVNKDCSEKVSLERKINNAISKGHTNIADAATEAQKIAEESGCRITEIEEVKRK